MAVGSKECASRGVLQTGVRRAGVYRLDGGAKGVVARLSVNGAEFWLSEESPEHGNFSPESLSGSSVKMILTVANPDAVFAQR